MNVLPGGLTPELLDLSDDPKGDLEYFEKEAQEEGEDKEDVSSLAPDEITSIAEEDINLPPHLQRKLESYLSDTESLPRRKRKPREDDL